MVDNKNNTKKQKKHNSNGSSNKRTNSKANNRANNKSGIRTSIKSGSKSKSRDNRKKIQPKSKNQMFYIIDTGWKWKLAFAAICLAVSVGLQYLARTVDGFANIYAKYVYPIWVNTIGRVMSIVPVSVVEILLYVLIMAVIISILKIIFRRKGCRWACIGSGAMSLLAAASLLFAVYTVNCGINYYNEPFSEREDFVREEHSVAQLKALCQQLTQEVNTYSEQLLRTKKGLCRLETNVGKRAVEAMHRAGDVYTSLEGYYPVPKMVIVSQILSVQQLSGVYSPFTVEANYNRHMTSYNIPFTMCHELSHLRGFMREDEANFIAWLACRYAEDIDFKYSGALMGWIYATNELYAADYEMYMEVSSALSEEVWVDLRANSAFWDQYEGKTAEIAERVNDTYLKVNNQTDGVKSYHRMVDLMFSYYAKEGLLE